jgi:hypothetical protein
MEKINMRCEIKLKWKWVKINLLAGKKGPNILVSFMFLFGKYLIYLISKCCYLRENLTIYNIWCVVFKSRSIVCTKTLKSFCEVTPENATYNCPCEKTTDGRYKPIVLRVCP